MKLSPFIDKAYVYGEMGKVLAETALVYPSSSGTATSSTERSRTSSGKYPPPNACRDVILIAWPLSRP